MAASLRDLRRKIRSIQSTQKITSAMQLVAASKMQRATRRATESRPYTELAKEILHFITPSIDPTTEPFFAQRPEKRILVCLITTNRGLAGALNTQLIREFLKFTEQASREGKEIKVVAIGAKGRNHLIRYMRDTLLADFPAPDAVPNFHDALPIAKILIDEFKEERVDGVYLAYNRFVSTLRQEPVIHRYLPFVAQSLDESSALPVESIFEPSQAEILHALVPRVLRAELYQTLLETHASEQSARMLAMKNATDNASDLLDDLKLTYNSYRQAGITGELLDIAAGAAALEG